MVLVSVHFVRNKINLNALLGEASSNQPVTVVDLKPDHIQLLRMVGRATSGKMQTEWHSGIRPITFSISSPFQDPSILLQYISRSTRLRKIMAMICLRRKHP